MLGEWIPLQDWRRLPAVSGIYVIRHRESGKEYVGKSANVSRRVRDHTKMATRYRFHSSLRKHGIAAFDVCLLLTGPEETLSSLEVLLIASRKTLIPNGYNSTLGGEGSTGAKWTDSARAAAAVRSASRKHSPETKEMLRQVRLANNPHKGKRHTEVAKARMRASAQRVPRPPEVRLKISQTLAGRVNPLSSQPGELNAMYGVRRGRHHCARKVLVWVRDALVPLTFDCVLDAADFFGIREQTASSRCNGAQAARDGSVWSYS